MPSDTTEFIEDFKWATEKAGLCANRVWSVAGKDLQKLLPPKGRLSARVESMRPARENRAKTSSERQASAELEGHEICTFDFCEHSLRDFTGVEQRHECQERPNCAKTLLFSRETLKRALDDGKPTAWSLDRLHTIKRSQPYMAISHVWSDGTGTGDWPEGEVNECLYEYFEKIAGEHQCQGIWWDTLCIPKGKPARQKAIRQIQGNYANAEFTLVHDCFLRNWIYDEETACFAILMSPWFSRGWTALELAKSKKVMVIFGTSGGDHFIQDLDKILSKDGDSSPQGRASAIIGKLRKEVTSINDLLTILGPRHTSWPKDKAIISALLMGVPLGGNNWQRDIYENILRNLPELTISPEHLFHSSATMSPISWCPINIFSMPTVDESKKGSLQIEEDLSLVGMWICTRATIPKENYNWRGMHPFMMKRLQDRLWETPQKEPGRFSSFLLFEKPVSDRALLVNKSKIGGSSSCYEYVGAVFFNTTPEIAENEPVRVKIIGEHKS